MVGEMTDYFLYTVLSYFAVYLNTRTGYIAAAGHRTGDEGHTEEAIISRVESSGHRAPIAQSHYLVR